MLVVEAMHQQLLVSEAAARWLREAEEWLHEAIEEIIHRHWGVTREGNGDAGRERVISGAPCGASAKPSCSPNELVSSTRWWH